jgi:hypothetical protein
MEFEEVNNFIKSNGGERSSLEIESVMGNPYHSLIIHQPVTRKPTLSNFVSRLKQQSSKTRFVEKYKKLSNVSDTDDEIIPDDGTYNVCL